MKVKHIHATHPIDYSKGYNSNTAFKEWLLWITAMAPFDVGTYD